MQMLSNHKIQIDVLFSLQIKQLGQALLLSGFSNGERQGFEIALLWLGS